jgi:anti-sigma regulatory factor (Ser/Thr protein kinase)
MDNSNFKSYHIAERSYVSFIKREIHNLVKPKFTQRRTGEIDLIISELTSNLIKHVGSGELLYKLSGEDDEVVFEVICVDNGPGIKDIIHSMGDGVSSKNTLGHGIGSISRLSNISQFYSIEGWGTIVYAKVYNSATYRPDKKNVMVRSLKVPLPGEEVSGDGVFVKIIEKKTLVFAGDGLGHGVHAHEAATKAIDAFTNSDSADPSMIIREIHEAVKKTRGLVCAVAVLDHEKKTIEVCGVGNIYVRLHRGLEYKNYLGNNGVVGLNIPRRLENANFEMSKPQFAIFCSDGIKAKWDLTRYPSILKYDPIIIAAALYKDYGRQTDDMSILIVKVQ